MLRKIAILICAVLLLCGCSVLDQAITNELLEKSSAAQSEALQEQYIMPDENKTQNEVVWPPRVFEKLTPLYVAKEPVIYKGDGFTVTVENAAVYDALMQDIDSPLEDRNNRILEAEFEVPYNENMLYNGIFYSLKIQYDNPKLYPEACDSYTLDTYYDFSFYLNNEKIPDRGMIANSYFDQGNLTNSRLGLVHMKNEGFIFYDRPFNENSKYVLCIDSVATGYIEIELPMISPNK